MARYLVIFVGMIYVSLVLSGVVQFHLWSQVEYIHGLEASLLDVMSSVHFSRYLLVLPVYAAAELLSFSPDYIFSIFCVVLLMATVRILVRIYYIIMKKSVDAVPLLLLIFFIVLSLFMNGRIIAAFFAMSLSLYVYACWNERVCIPLIKLCCIVVVSLWFSSVSSGTFFIVYGIFCMVFFEILAIFLTGNKLKKVFLAMGSLIVVFLALAFPLGVRFIEKNTLYFGSFWEMLEHGSGNFILALPVDILVLLLLLMFMIVLFGSVVYWNLRGFRPLVVGIMIGIIGGAFGFSTLMMALLPIVLLLSCLSMKLLHEETRVKI